MSQLIDFFDKREYSEPESLTRGKEDSLTKSVEGRELQLNVFSEKKYSFGINELHKGV